MINLSVAFSSFYNKFMEVVVFKIFHITATHWKFKDVTQYDQDTEKYYRHY